MGLKQVEVADAVGVSTATYSQYESGKREPNIDKLIKIARFLSVSTDELIGNGELDKNGFSVPIRETFAKNLSLYRKRCGITQEELSQKLSLKKTTISSWERGQSQPDIERIVKICSILGVSFNELCGVDHAKEGIDRNGLSLITAFKNANKGIKEAVLKLLDIEIINEDQ